MGNYERIAIQFITRINEHHGDVGDIIPYSLQLLQELTGPYLSLQVVPQDNYVARVRNATPFFLDDMALNAAEVQKFTDAGNNNTVYWKSIPAQEHTFSEILLALSSAIIMPVQQGNATVLIILGWSAPQEFGASFQSFAVLVQSHLNRTLRQSAAIQIMEADNVRCNALLKTMPQSIVFIDSEGLGGWVNDHAAMLLQLLQPGRQEPATLSAAMAMLRSRLLNAEEVNQQTARLFSGPDTAINGWNWQLDTGHYIVSIFPVNDKTVKGRLWIFERQNA